MYRQVNPKAPRAEAIKVIGEMTRQALNQPALQVPVAPEGGEIPPVTPAGTNVTPIAPAVPPKKQAPFTPARGGTGAAKKAEPNEWLELLDSED